MDFPKHNLEVLINENKQWYLISEGADKVLVEELPKENCVVYWKGDFASYIDQQVSEQVKIGLHQCLLSNDAFKYVPEKEFIKEALDMSEFKNRTVSIPIKDLKLKNGCGYGCDFPLGSIVTSHIISLLSKGDL